MTNSQICQKISLSGKQISDCNSDISSFNFKTFDNFRYNTDLYLIIIKIKCGTFSGNHINNDGIVINAIL